MRVQKKRERKKYDQGKYRDFRDWYKDEKKKGDNEVAALDRDIYHRKTEIDIQMYKLVEIEKKKNIEREVSKEIALSI